MSDCQKRSIAIIKLGGSILVDDQSYRRAARFIVRRLHQCSRECLLVVVSAQSGLTDQLKTLARSVTRFSNPRTLDLLWATGELRSVALLTLHLEEMNVPVVGLNVHEAGLRFHGSDTSCTKIESLSVEVRRAFDDHSVVVVPGFFATLANGTLVSLGRGGSDLTAVLLADELDAGQCELVKDVSGYFTDDPNVDSRAEHIPWLSYEQALRMADAGCELVQAEAIETARRTGVRLLVRSLDEMAPASVVSEKASASARDSRATSHCCRKADD